MDQKYVFEGALVSFREFMPRVYYAIYQGCLAAGFDKQQSFNLVQTYILSQNPAGSRPCNDIGPETNEP